jgi:hypothetical protein
MSILALRQNASAGSTLIIDHLGGEKFLVGLGARDFVIDDAHLAFTFAYHNPKDVHMVTISAQPNGSFKVSCFGRLVPGTLSAPILATEHNVMAENLAAVLGKLTGIDALQHRHF